ncbi:MAG: TMEM43 family protein [Methylococcales bacterium]
MMSDDSYTEVTEQSWFSRIGESIKGILFGFLLFIVAFPLLWWNEGRSVDRYNSLKEGQGMVISVPADAVNPSNDGKLVHTQGLATTQDILQDMVFSVAVPAIQLQRHVAMYQWKETEKSETQEKVGGSKTTTKTYSYDKTWSDEQINSSQFKKVAEHNNPPMSYKSQTFQAQNVSLGAFKLNANQIGRLSGEQDFPVQNVQAPAQLAGKNLNNTGTGFYLGNNPADPQIGDLQISFKIINPSNISLVAEQTGNSFSAYQTKAGSDIDLLEMGLLDANALFAIAERENTFITWGIRIAGFLLMWIGLSMILKPLSVLAAVLPFLGDLIAMGTGLFAFLLSLPFTTITIAIAWIVYRPLLAGILIAVAVLSLVAMKFTPRSHASMLARV